MPHSTEPPPDASSTLSLAPSGQMTTTAPPSKFRHVSSLSEKYIPQPTSTPRDRRSLPAELPGHTTLNGVVSTYRGQRAGDMTLYNNASKQRTQYYDEQFQYKGNTPGTVRERVQRDSPVIAELRTNVIIKDEFTLVTDLSYHLAARYTKPGSAVMVKVDHSACLAMGGTFDPCYIMSITGLPSQMGPTMNKRNAALIQSFLADILSVSPDRGIIKFQPVPEENFATNATTMLGEIEQQEKHQSGENSGNVRRAITNVGRKSIPSFKKSMSKLDSDAKATADPRPASAGPRPPTARTDSAAPSTVSEDRQETPAQMNASITSPGEAYEVYELPATEMDDQRPVTAHQRKSSAGSNGLRMNGVSSGALTSTSPGTPKTAKKSRPKTLSGESLSLQEQVKGKSVPHMAAVPSSRPLVQLSAPPKFRKDRPHSFLKHDPTNTAAKATPTNSSRPTTPGQRNSGVVATARSRESLHSRGTGSQSSAKQLSGTWTNESAQDKSRKKVERLTGEKPGEKREEKKDTEANTAKRRSTITATPVFPEPPPMPEDSRKVGKRKSFLSAFRRNTLQPQPAR